MGVCAEEVSQAFEHYDDDRSGTLTHDEYKKALRDLQIKVGSSDGCVMTEAQVPACRNADLSFLGQFSYDRGWSCQDRLGAAI